jgi:hypothetical protein
VHFSGEMTAGNSADLAEIPYKSIRFGIEKILI